MNNPRRVHGVTFDYRAMEERVPADHPLRELRAIVTLTLDELAADPQTAFAAATLPSLAPEKILRLRLLQALYSVRSEKLMLEQLGYNLLFRWFVGMTMDDRLWDTDSYARTREALLGTELARRFFALVRERATVAGLLADEHFQPDISMIDG